jgi:hypothetical protein
MLMHVTIFVQNSVRQEIHKGDLAVKKAKLPNFSGAQPFFSAGSGHFGLNHFCAKSNDMTPVGGFERMIRGSTITNPSDELAACLYNSGTSPIMEAVKDWRQTVRDGVSGA